MTGTPPGDQPTASAQRNTEDDDFDLLTYNEARARLAEEVEAETRRLAALEADTNAPASERTKSSDRLAALRDAVKRTSTVAIDAHNVEQFFGRYDAPAAVTGAETGGDRR